MSSVSLLDVVPVGMELSPGLHEMLEFLHVDSHEIAWDDDGVVITGETRVDSTNPNSSLFSPFVGGHHPDSDQPRPAWTWHDVSIGFRLSVARRPAAAVMSSALPTDVQTVVDAFDPATPATRSDAPDAQFRLDLLFNLVSVTIPKLKGGKLQGTLLVRDPDHPVVSLHLVANPAYRHAGLLHGHRLRRPARLVGRRDPRRRRPRDCQLMAETLERGGDGLLEPRWSGLSESGLLALDAQIADPDGRGFADVLQLFTGGLADLGSSGV